MTRGLWLASLTALATPFAALVACTSGDDVAPPAIDAGAFDAQLVDGAPVTFPDTGTPDATRPGDDAGTTGPDGSNGVDAAPAVVDRFRHQWPVTADVPDPSSYVVDADAGVVTDKVTGLVWTRDLLQQEQTSFDAGYPGLVGTQVQAEARAACAAASVGGFHDWRLPSMVELLTIIDFSSSDWNDPASFQETSYGAEYWADTAQDGLYLVYDDHYHPWSFRGGSGDGPMRCVRSTYPVTTAPQPPPAGRYTVTGPTAIDHVTKLEWQIAETVTQMYTEATSYCANLAGSDAGIPPGGAAWRLPTLKEVATIWSEADGGPEPSVFGPVNASGTSIWVSNTYWATQSIPYAHTQMRFGWSPGGDKTFYWEAAADFAGTRCVREAP